MRRTVMRLAATCLGLYWIALAAEATTLRISHQFASDIDARDRAAKRFAADVAVRAPQIQVVVHANSTLGIKPADQFNALLEGRVDMLVLPLFYASSKIPELSIALMPGVPESPNQAALLFGSEFHRRLSALCEANGFRLLTWWWLKGGIISTHSRLEGLPSYKGLNVRSGDAIFDEMFEGVGANTLSLPSTEILLAMKSGKLDLAQTSIESLLSMKLETVARTAVIGGPSLFVSYQPLVISLRSWERLSPEGREAIEAAARISNREFLEEQQQVESKAIQAFLAAGVKVRPMPVDQYIDWLRTANDTSWRSYRRKSLASSELLDAMLSSFINSSPHDRK